ncbi:hypothetical protein V1511DRAFT_496565 [Dipodascopsis uninucleata]
MFFYLLTMSLQILANMGIFLTILLGKLVQTIMFGSLRVIEMEHLYEKAWYAVTETCLAMTIFRDEFDIRFLVMFTTLLFIKIFHWLCADRVEYMEQAVPSSPILFHVRLSATILILNFVDFYFIRFALDDIVSRGPNMMVMFAFEFAILATTAMSMTGRYLLSLIEAKLIAYSNNELDSWERKGEFLFYLDLATDFIKLLIYISFFLLILTVYGLPLHIIRDVYLTMRSFLTRIRDFMRYRQATSQMNSRYPDATVQEVSRETTCIICREEMIVADQSENQPERMRPKKLPCGHVLHFGCLRSWLERQQRCPTCRRPVLESNSSSHATVQPATPPVPEAGAHPPNDSDQSNDEPQNDLHRQTSAVPTSTSQPHNSNSNAQQSNEDIRRLFSNQLPHTPPHIPFAYPNNASNRLSPNLSSTNTQSHETSGFASQSSREYEPSLNQQQQPMSLPPGFTLPPDWAILPLRQFSNGLQQIQIRENVWLTLATVQYVIPNESAYMGPEPTASRVPDIIPHNSVPRTTTPTRQDIIQGGMQRTVPQPNASTVSEVETQVEQGFSGTDSSPDRSNAFTPTPELEQSSSQRTSISPSSHSGQRQPVLQDQDDDGL